MDVKTIIQTSELLLLEISEESISFEISFTDTGVVEIQVNHGDDDAILNESVYVEKLATLYDIAHLHFGPSWGISQKDRLDVT